MRLFTSVLLLTLALVSLGCGDEKNKGVNKDLDRPKPAADK